MSQVVPTGLSNDPLTTVLACPVKGLLRAPVTGGAVTLQKVSGDRVSASEEVTRHLMKRNHISAAGVLMPDDRKHGRGRIFERSQQFSFVTLFVAFG